MGAQGAVNARALQADENAKVERDPLWVLPTAISALVVAWDLVQEGDVVRHDGIVILGVTKREFDSILEDLQPRLVVCLRQAAELHSLMGRNHLNAVRNAAQPGSHMAYLQLEDDFQFVCSLVDGGFDSCQCEVQAQQWLEVLPFSVNEEGALSNDLLLR